MAATLWVSREAVNGDPVHEVYEAARQAFVQKLAGRFGLKVERRLDCLDEGYVDYAFIGTAGQVARFLKELARYNLGGFTVDVPEEDSRAKQIIEKASEELARMLRPEVCCM